MNGVHKKFIICYLSFSGNTEEVAEIIRDYLELNGHIADMYDIGQVGLIPNLSEYDYILIGTFTWDKGSTPNEVKDFVLELGYKPNNVLVFGSGDTQFGGDELFCKAVDKLAKFYNSKYPVLKIEQSPRGSQKNKVLNWIKYILER